MEAEDYIAGLSDDNKETFKEIKANDDGSITIVMTAEKNKEYMNEYKTEIDAQFKEIIDDQESFKNITDIKYNENLSIFTITLANPEVTFQDAMSIIIFIYPDQCIKCFREPQKRILTLSLTMLMPKTTLSKPANCQNLKTAKINIKWIQI